jgi:enoyl-CoA hydratase/carnithine racemase
MTLSQSPSGSTLHLEIEGPIAWIVIDNAPRRNAFTAAMWGQMAPVVAAADGDERVRVIVIRGSGTGAFSAGADISEFDAVRSGDKVKDYDRVSDEAFRALATSQKPTIAMVHGSCIGGGFGVASSCDLRLADEAAVFAIPAARLGIGYDPRWVAPLLALASPPRVKELLFTGRKVGAQEALRLGFVNRVTPSERLVDDTRALALEIAGNAPLTVRAAKLAVDEVWRRPDGPRSAELVAAVGACFASEDYAEGRRAFLEKRRAEFKGR